MNKRADVELDMIADFVYSVIILGSAFVVFVGLMTYLFQKPENLIKQRTVDLDNDEIYVQILKSKNDNIFFNDLIVQSYINNDVTTLTEKLTLFLNQIYLKKVCWSLFIEDKEWINIVCKEELEYPIVDSTLYLPLPKNFNQIVLKTRFIIKGYS